MNLITLISLTLVQASIAHNCVSNGAKKTLYRGTGFNYDNTVVVADCYNFGDDECPYNLEIPSTDDDIFKKFKHSHDDIIDRIVYRWYKCDDLDRLLDWQDIFRANGWTCDKIHG
ncbi:hypothetical protein CONCODRAFT_13392 [Conidiobolus coronatus NRRL 28638]|uniref:Uncharacterized protein n=1 Tax=Conidiobolus coronatus (strain ATCC 28846 / CBS 209.66 / NRRL 28638) TaxID=796925 RepID=A0A137NR23_CONC2|nr:hypothetical protein CONCODRAFT_13392 [Conidiobolus coronatus NRRL 28638]|eukprot:KXN65130.1 hypothetical protein CONCODRAFT_13392 [Conidiobolus coronatus NRRL 28638]